MKTTTPDALHQPTSTLTEGVVYGSPKRLLRLEGAAALIAATYGYSQTDAGWGLFALLFFVPDLSMLGYLRGLSVGAAVYNFGHSYLSPVGLALVAWWLDASMLAPITLIWFAHIGFDRAVGYGFKYADAFKHTHLGTPFGRKASAVSYDNLDSRFARRAAVS